jgi:hypothetical protein
MIKFFQKPDRSRERREREADINTTEARRVWQTWPLRIASSAS